MRRNSGTPIYYLLEITSLASGATTSKSITFNDPGVLRSLQFASETAGVAGDPAGVKLNISRQNARGLTTGAILASGFCTDGTGGYGPTIPTVLGDYPLRRQDTLNVSFENTTANTIDTIQLIFVLHADVNE